MGHSVGELAAAQAAGVFSLEDGMRFAAARGSLLSGPVRAPCGGLRAAERVESVVGSLDGSPNGSGVCVSAYNGAHQVVSGPASGIDTLLDRLESDGIRARRLNTTRAFHSALVEPALDQLEAALDGVAIQSPAVTVISNLTGGPVKPGTALDGSYWRRHAREAVAFARGVRALEDLEVDLVVEVGPHAVLGPMVTLAWPDRADGRNASGAPAVLASMRRPRRNGSSPEPATGFVDAVAEAYAAGLEISFEGLFAGETRRRISLPGYPFQRERYWLDPAKRRRTEAGHPLLGLRYESARGEVTFETEVFPSDPAWLEDHRVFGRLVAPGALYGAMAATASLTEDGGPVVMEDLQLHNPLVFPEPVSGNGAGEVGRTMQVVLDDPDQSASRRVQIYSRGNEAEWTLHVEGRVSADAPVPEAGQRIDLDEVAARLAPADVPATTAPSPIPGSTSVRRSGRWGGSGRVRARRSVRCSCRRRSAATAWTCIRWCWTAASRWWA